MNSSWKRIGSIIAALGFATTMQISNSAWASNAAEHYPDKRIVIVTPMAAGSPFDMLTRVFAEKMRQKTGVPVVVENVTGGQGHIATQRVLNSTSDGYTLLLTSTGLATLPYVFENAGYKIEDFMPVAPLGQAPYILFASSSVEANDIPSVMEYIKENAKNLNHGVLTASHLSTLLARKIGAAAGGDHITEIGYRGSGDMTRALLVDDVQLIATAYSVVGPHLESGKVKYIGSLGETRTDQLPDLPTFIESGYPDLSINVWAGMFAKADVPTDILNKIKKLSEEIISDPEYITAMIPTGMEPWKIDIEDIPQALRAESDAFIRDVEKFGLELN